MAAQNPLIERINVAQGFVNAATLLANAWATIQKYYQIYNATGMTFTSTDFNGLPLAYIDPTQMGTLITNLNSFGTFMTAGGTFAGAQGGLIFSVAAAQPVLI